MRTEASHANDVTATGGATAEAERRGVELLANQNQILELVARGAPLERVLPTISRFIEAQIPGALCSILRLRGNQLWHTVADRLPPAYTASIEGVVVGPNVGSCGNAAYSGETTIVEDLATHPNWMNYRHLALPHGLRSAWSMAIRAPDNSILGAFGIYTGRPAVPTAEQLRLIAVASHLAGLAIAQEHDRATLEQRAAALVDADRRKDVFLATLAHELRNPLAAIVTAIELMHLAGTDERVVTRTREVVSRQTGLLVHLVDDLLDVSRITQGKVRLHSAPCAVRELVHRALESTRAVVDHRQLTVAGPDAPVIVSGDAKRLIQVLTNLIGNAGKYTEPGGAITIDWSVVGDDVVIEVRDNGEGMRAELLPHVFDLFVQAERTHERAGGGLGIGLTLVRTIVELHGGHVTARSPGPGLGSVFSVRLPLDASSSMPVSPPPPARRSLRRSAGGERVLVVDDNLEASELMTVALRTAGYEVRSVGDGLAALRVTAQWDPHAVLLDIGLPLLDGYEVARELRRRETRPALRLIAVTGYGQDADRARAMAAGFDSVLVKPATLDAVLDALVELPA